MQNTISIPESVYTLLHTLSTNEYEIVFKSIYFPKKFLEDNKVFLLKFVKPCVNPDFIVVRHKNGFKHTIKKADCVSWSRGWVKATGKALNRERVKAAIYDVCGKDQKENSGHNIPSADETRKQIQSHKANSTQTTKVDIKALRKKYKI